MKYLILLQPSKNWAKKIQEEWKILENDLPGIQAQFHMICYDFLFLSRQLNLAYKSLEFCLVTEV